MHASLAFVNAAGTSDEDLRLLNVLLSTSVGPRPGKSKDKRQAEEESKEKPISKPGGFKNDPKDSTNPNEVRERSLKKLKR